MSARIHRPTPTPGPSTQRNAGAAAAKMPEYQPPEFALNAEAQRSIANLLRKHNIRSIEGEIAGAQERLTNTGAELHDKLHEHENWLARRQSKPGPASQADELASTAEDVKDLRRKVENMANRMEKEMRVLIDCGVSAKAMQDAVSAAEADARANASTQASTQHNQTQTQQRSRRRGRGAEGDEDEDEEDEDEDEEPQWEPTDPAGASQRAPLGVFDKHVHKTRDRFQAQSLYERYAENEAYVNFKKVLFDAQHPDDNDNQQLPDPSQWFDEGGVPPAGTRQDVDNAGDSDDDIAIVGGQISTKCPLTLQEFTHPLSSKKCKHTFEAHAIQEMISNSTMRPKAAQCPVPGCSVLLEKGDLHVDKLVMRKIQRLQRARRLREEADDSDDGPPDGTQNRSHIIDDDDDDDELMDEDDEPRDTKPRVKPEPRATGSTSRTSQAPCGNQTIDLDESNDEDVDMED